MKKIFSSRFMFYSILLVCSGCATMHSDFTPVQLDRPMLLVTEATLVMDCKSLKEVSAESLWGGFAMQGVARWRVKLNMLGTAKQLGGNVVLLKKLESGFGGANGNGQAYYCPDSQFDSARLVTSTETYGGKD